MVTDDFSRGRIDRMIDMAHPLAVPAGRLFRVGLQTALAPCFVRGAPAGA